MKDASEIRLSEEEIYERDISWLREADIVVAEVSSPSLGVGYEIGKAEQFGKYILCLYRKQEGKRLSAMIAGNKNLTVKTYQTVPKVLRIIDGFIRAREKVLDQFARGEIEGADGMGTVGNPVHMGT